MVPKSSGSRHPCRGRPKRRRQGAGQEVLQLIKKAELTHKTAHTGVVFGSALNLNIHFHMLFLDGATLADLFGFAE